MLHTINVTVARNRFCRKLDFVEIDFVESRKHSKAILGATKIVAVAKLFMPSRRCSTSHKGGTQAAEMAGKRDLKLGPSTTASNNWGTATGSSASFRVRPTNSKQDGNNNKQQTMTITNNSVISILIVLLLLRWPNPGKADKQRTWKIATNQQQPTTTTTTTTTATMVCFKEIETLISKKH